MNILILLLVVIAVIIVLALVIVFRLELFVVVGESMLPTMKDSDIVLVRKRFSKLSKEDVVCLFDSDGKILIKRVSGISDKYVYVLGDNTNNSRDSREFGWLPIKHVIGKVIFPKTTQKTI